MEYLLRFCAILFRVLSIVTKPFIVLLNNVFHQPIQIPPIEDPILRLTATDLAEKIRNREISSEQVVRAYINRIKMVNPKVNAVVQDRFEDAILEASSIDEKIITMKATDLEKQYPLFGVPFTVKESCGLKGYSQSIGSLPLKGLLAVQDGDTIANLKAAGAIPLLISNVPEYCKSWETFNFITGRTLNPFNATRTSGGSSGGEAALLGSGSSTFGVGSDFAGSIRVPAMYCGIFGHIPTGGVMSINGHLPISKDECFKEYLAIGPLCRYSKDLPTITRTMAGKKADLLNLDKPVNVAKIKIFYVNHNNFSLIDTPIQKEIKQSLHQVVKHFQSVGNETQQISSNLFKESLEISLAKIFALEDVPHLLQPSKNDPNKLDNLFWECLKSLIGQSRYTFAGLFFCILVKTGGLIPHRKQQEYFDKGDILREHLKDLLGENGVLLYPTYPSNAVYHYESIFKLFGVVYPMIFNVLGLPSTQVPVGLDDEGLPIGIQVIAAPYQDRLCFSVAAELEKTFGGWTPPFDK